MLGVVESIVDLGRLSNLSSRAIAVRICEAYDERTKTPTPSKETHNDA